MPATRFPEKVFEKQTGRPPVDRIDVEDVESVLARVWDGGGTVVAVVATAFGDRVTRAIVRDPSGRLFEIVEAA